MPPSPPLRSSGLAYRIGDGRYIGGGYRSNAENADLQSSVATIFPDSSAEHFFGVTRCLSLRPPAGRAGHDHGMTLAGRLAVFWR
jgi:NTE family protein